MPRLAGKCPSLRVELAYIGIAGQLAPAADQRRVDGCGAEERVRWAPGKLDAVSFDGAEDAAHVSNRVHPFRGSTSVSGHPSRHQVHPREALVGHDNVQLGRLEHDRHVGVRIPHVRGASVPAE